MTGRQLGWLPCSLIEEADGYDVNQFVIPDWCCSALEGMENYTKLGKLGEGTYGVVYKVGEEGCANIIIDPL